MNKERMEEFEHLRTMLALKIYPKVEPDVEPPQSSCELSLGYDFNAHCGSVERACSSKVSHGFGWTRTTSQGPRRLYSSAGRALQAMLHEMSMDFAKRLRAVEKKLEEENAKIHDGH